MENSYAVIILDCDGKEIKRTNKYAKVRRMVNDGKATVVKQKPFTIQMVKEK